MSMFGPKEGTWWMRSKSDPRWNADGRSLVGGFSMNPECVQKVSDLNVKYGPPPADLEYGYMKD